MSQQPEEPRSPSPRKTIPSATKLISLTVLILATLIPTALISMLISERETRQDETRTAIARSWGPEQTLTGPALLLAVSNGDDKATYAKLAPKKLEATAEILPEVRRRGFFSATIYTAVIHLTGTFAVSPSVRDGSGRPTTPQPNVLLAVALSDLSGVSGVDQVSVGGHATKWQPIDGTPCGERVLVAPVDLTQPNSGDADIPFSAELHLRGTGRLQFDVPAKQKTITIRGAWPSPSFIGDELPTKTDLTHNEFDAQWQTDGIEDPRASTWTCALDLAASPGPRAVIGVDLVETMPIYRMVSRAAKYGLLLVVLAFAVYLVFELLNRLEINVVQYGLLAGSLCLFALLLVSLGEWIGYTAAYLVSALLVIAQASLFTASVVRQLKPTLSFVALLASLFCFIYVLLGLENLALLTGTAALFVTLSILMGVTQRVQRAA